MGVVVYPGEILIMMLTCELRELGTLLTVDCDTTMHRATVTTVLKTILNLLSLFIKISVDFSIAYVFNT